MTTPSRLAAASNSPRETGKESGYSHMAWGDLSYSLRVLSRKPALTAAAVLALALGIGAVTAVFTALDAVVLHSLPFRDPDRLVMIWARDLKKGWRSQMEISGPDYRDLRKQARDIDELGAFTWPRPVNVSDESSAERIRSARATASMLRTIGVEPMLGRSFTAEEETIGHGHVVLLGAGLWRGRFGGRTDILSQNIRLNGNLYTIVGVLPDSFRMPLLQTVDVLLPVPLDSGDLQKRGNRALAVVARVRAGVSPQRAQSGLDTVAAQWALAFQDSNGNWGLNAMSLRENVVGSAQNVMLVLFGSVTLVLLIACANVANLMLARAFDRQREFAVRLSLGASRFGIARLLLSESIVVGLLGGALGVVFAVWLLHAAAGIAPSTLPRIKDAAVDGRALLFAVAISLASSVLVGLIPALRCFRLNLGEALKAGRSSSDSIGTRRIRSTVVAGEFAVVLILLASAGLLVKSLRNVQAVDPGFDARDVATARVSLSGPNYRNKEQPALFFQHVIERLENSPGVKSTGAVSHLPMSTTGMNNYFTVGGRTRPGQGEEPLARTSVATPGYFQAMGIPLVRGRTFNTRDSAGAARVIVVNQTLVQRFFSGEDPLGRSINLLAPAYSDADALEPADVTIVGVVGNVKYASLEELPLNEIYVPYAQNPVPSMFFAVRAPVRSSDALSMIRLEVFATDRNQPAFDVCQLDERLSAMAAPRRFNTLLMSAFAGVGVLLAAIGIFGVMAYSVAQRTREIGIRMALGADPRRVLRMVLGQAARLALTGMAVGLVMSWVSARFLSGLLYGVAAHDPLTLAAVCGVLAGIALLASYYPARRATRLDPAAALRNE